jgi:hypothetical protein
MVMAAHQLVSSVSVLGLCVRPLLLAGLPNDPAHSPEGPPSRDAAGQVIASAMMQLLPGIDINDCDKTNAVIKFYIAMLSSVASFEVRPPGH